MNATPAWMADGRSRMAPFLVCRAADEVIAFTQDAFGASLVRAPLRRGDGSLWNAELNIGDCTFMVGGATPGFERPGFVYLHVPEVEATFELALSKGATAIQPPERRFYGDIDGGVEDMGGNWWWIASHAEDLTDDEIAAAARQEEARRRQGE